MYPGQFPRVRQNLWNIVLAVDLSKASSLQFLTQSVVNIIQRNFPFRWGVVPLVDSDDAAKAARLFYYLVDNFGRANTTTFMTSVCTLRFYTCPTERRSQMVTESTSGGLNFKAARTEFNALLEQYTPRKEGASTDFDAIISGGQEGDPRIAAARAYAKRLALSPPKGSGYSFVNGKFYDLDDVCCAYHFLWRSSHACAGLFPCSANRAVHAARIYSGEGQWARRCERKLALMEYARRSKPKRSTTKPTSPISSMTCRRPAPAETSTFSLARRPAHTLFAS